MESSLAGELAEISHITLSFHPRIPIRMKPTVQKSDQAYDLFMKTWNTNTIYLCEEFKVMYLNRSNRVLGICTVSSGGITGTVVDLRIIFSSALICLATNIIVAHNHPSGGLQPSVQDEHLTKRMSDAGKLLDIRLSDHLIISPDGYYSFADEGML